MIDKSAKLYPLFGWQVLRHDFCNAECVCVTGFT